MSFLSEPVLFKKKDTSWEYLIHEKVGSQLDIVIEYSFYLMS